MKHLKHLKHFIILTIALCMTVFPTIGLADSVVHTDEMYSPRGMCYDGKNGRIVFVDYDANAVFELNLTDFKVKKIAGGSLGKNAYGLPVGGYRDGKVDEALFKNPSDVVVLDTGAIVVADTGNHAIRQIYEGNVTTIAGGTKEGLKDGIKQVAEFSYPSGMAISGSGVIYIADTENNRIRKMTGGSVKTIEVEIHKPSGIYMMNRDLYITSKEDNKIYLLQKEKNLTEIAGSAVGTGGYRDGRLDSAKFSVPSDVFEYRGALYIADAGNHAIRKIFEVNVDQDKNKNKKEGISVIETLVGGKIGFYDEEGKRFLLDTPRSVILVDNRLYIADTNNGRILVLDNAGKLTAVTDYEKCEDPNTVYIYVDGGKIEPEDVAPVVIDGTTYVPTRLLTESIGGEVKWLNDEKAVLCMYDGKEIKITKDRYIIRSGRSMVPLRNIIENFGLNIEWNKKYRAVIIRTY